MLQTNVTGVFGEHSLCSGHTGFAPLTGVCAFPVYTAQAPGCSIWSGPCAACGSSPRVLHRSADLVAPAFCAFPFRAAQAARSLTGAFSPPRSQPQLPPAPVGCMCLLPYASPAPVLAGLVPAPCVSLRPSRRMSPIQNLRRSLVRNWRPVCSEVGAAVLGVEPAPFLSPLPPVSGGSGPVRSLRALLWTCSVPLFCERPAMCLAG